MYLVIEKSINIDYIDNIQSIFGSFDFNIKRFKDDFGVVVVFRENVLKIMGESEKNVYFVFGVLEHIITLIQNNQIIDEQLIDYIIDISKNQKNNLIDDIHSVNDNIVCINAKGKAIKPKTINQKSYIESINQNSVVLGVGPAGTGKTYLAVVMAVAYFKNYNFDKIILTRPAVEAGEKLGFLPGDLQDKIDPYLQPLYDSLFDIIGPERCQKYRECGKIEVAPLAYMRGRTLNNSFIILDEAQNTTPEQMKMFLTRLGTNSKMVITGDITQIDIQDKNKSGLIQAIKILKNIDDICIFNFDSIDIVRNTLVKDIIKAYNKFDEKMVTQKDDSR